MLLELSIRNFALVEQATLRWSAGLNVLTGETGAGKSILIDAVGALMGSRLGPDWIRTGADRAIVEGVFVLPGDADGALSDGHSLTQLLAEYDLQGDEETLILTREIGRASGRTLCRINGRPVLLSVLQEVGRHLIDVHGQSEHLSLLRTREHLELLDRYGGLAAPRAEISRQVAELEQVRAALRGSDDEARRLAREAMLLRHEIAEIEGAAPALGEDDELLQQRSRLRNAERLRALALSAYVALQGGDADAPGALDALGSASLALGELAGLDAAATEQRDALDGAVLATEECARELRRYAEAIEDDPQQLQAVEERLHTLRELCRKYGGGIAETLSYAAAARQKLDQLEHHEAHVADLQARETALVSALGLRAAELSALRRERAAALATAVERELADLRLAGARFAIAVHQIEAADGVPVDGRTVAIDRTGVDRVEFLLAANAGDELRPLARVASGGEMARILLALKTVLAGIDVRPTLIFDEIDVGVGGRLGQVLGEKLWCLADRHQILCVTHLPQLAAFGQQHLLVRKQEERGATQTLVESLEPPGRVAELAAMLGGDTQANRRSARELLARAADWQACAGGAADTAAAPDRVAHHL